MRGIFTILLSTLLSVCSTHLHATFLMQYDIFKLRVCMRAEIRVEAVELVTLDLHCEALWSSELNCHTTEVMSHGEAVRTPSAVR